MEHIHLRSWGNLKEFNLIMLSTEQEASKRFEEMSDFVQKQPGASVVHGFHATFQDSTKVDATQLQTICVMPTKLYFVIVGILLDYSWNIPAIFQLYSRGHNIQLLWHHNPTEIQMSWKWPKLEMCSSHMFLGFNINIPINVNSIPNIAKHIGYGEPNIKMILDI